tara:strand:- start:3 stop:581 length:579 start_codon:yes stop_codon:yes gene_type:complete
MAGIGDYDSNKPFRLKSQGMPFKEIGSSSVNDSPLPLHEKGHGLGKILKNTFSNVKQKIVTGITKSRVKKSEKKDKDHGGIVPGTRKTLDTYIETKGSNAGNLKPKGKNTPIDIKHSKGFEFTRGGGDPYIYKTKDDGQTFQYKKIGETGWSDVKGGHDKIMESYVKSIEKPLKNVKKDKEIKHSEYNFIEY